MEDHKKDIVDQIIDRLKSVDELPYREGAWEGFQSKHVNKPRATTSIWYAAAALFVFLGIGAFWLINQNHDEDSILKAHVETQKPDINLGGSVEFKQSEVISSREKHDNIENTIDQYVSSNTNNTYGLVVDKSYVNMPDLPHLYSQKVVANDFQHLISDLFIEPSIIRPDVKMLSHIAGHSEGMILSEGHLLAQQNQHLTLENKEVNGQNKLFRLNDKVSLGIAVAPSSTDQKLNFGGGLLLSYHFSKKLSVRTGAVFNQYEVGELKDPLEPSNVEIARDVSDVPQQAKSQYSNLANNNSVSFAAMPIIPNINAVSGTVRALDIPLELKFNAYKGFYATAGASYAAVINQRRYAHFIDNVYSTTFNEGLPTNEAEMRSAMQPVTKKVESVEENVRTNGFGGFINMSIGKEVNMKKGISFSLEPYIKLPVGNFKHADMNYTNGGIRIITNF